MRGVHGGVSLQSVRVVRGLLGGEWGGWCCTFDAQTGSVKPIPDKHCSETQIEWGQVPVGFEELQTEAFSPIPYMDGSEQTAADVPSGDGPEPLRRRCVQVHPSFGCGGDSLPGDAKRCLLPTPRSNTLEWLATTATASAAVGAHAWALDEHVQGSTWRLESVLRGAGGQLPTSTANAFPSLGERTRVSVLFDVATGELVAEAPHPSTPHLKPRPAVQVWQERLWNEVCTASGRKPRGRRPRTHSTTRTLSTRRAALMASAGVCPAAAPPMHRLLYTASRAPPLHCTA